MRTAPIATILSGIALLATAPAVESKPQVRPQGQPHVQAEPPGLRAFVHDRHLARYTVAMADLNGDKRPEALVYAMATKEGGGTADLCGSGGCALYVLALVPKGYRLITTVSVARPPVRILPQITHGWHDLSVRVGGGGIIPGYAAQLRFDGRSYPSNPTTPPATALEGAPGRIVIDAGAARLGSGPGQ